MSVSDTTLLFVGIVLLICAYILLAPGPDSAALAKIGVKIPWYEYLPSGAVYSILTDSQTSGTALAQLCRKYGDTIQFWLGPRRTVVCGHPADVAQILSDTTKFARSDAMCFVLQTTAPNSLLTMPRNVHQAARKKFRHIFNSSLLRDFHPRMLTALLEFTEDLSAVARQGSVGEFSPPIDLSCFLSTLTFRVITNVAFGINLSRQERLSFARDMDCFLDGLFKEMIGYCYRWLLYPGEVHKHLVQNRDVVKSTCRRIIRSRSNETQKERESRPRDVLDAILEIEEGDLESATSQVLVFALGGSHTVTHSLCWLLYEALQRPNVMQRIKAEISQVAGNRLLGDPFTYEDVDKLCYLRRVWKETLRFRPPGSLFVREATCKVMLNGSRNSIVKGTQIAALLDRAHKHPDFWTNPDVFDPDRWEASASQRAPADCVPVGAFVPFSVGQSSCPGQFFGEYEGILTLAHLLRHFDVELACDPSAVMSRNSWVNVGRYASRGDGIFDMGIPFRIRFRC